jgi:two-component system cell cycle sensor histidine kinase/response regulator CckA
MAPPSLLTPYWRGTVAVVFLLGIALSIIVWRYAVKQDAERLRTGFISRAQTQASVANQHLRAYREMVHSLRDSFLGQQIVTRQEFTNVARALLDRHPGVQALQWVQIVSSEQRHAFEEQVSQELGRPFVIRRRQTDHTLLPAEKDREHFVITYVEPLAGNEATLGYDVLTAPSVPMLTAARADRQFKVSRTFRLAQSRPGQTEPGIVFILPFWPVDRADTGVEGFVQGVFWVQTMLAQSHGLTTNEALDTYYFDTEDPARPELLYANLGGAEPLRTPGADLALPPLDDPGDFHATLTLGGRSWSMIIRPNAAWVRASASHQPLIILAAGLLITVLFTGFVDNLFRRTARIEEVVQERTRQLRASEARLQDILDHSPAIIFLKDLEGRYLLCNRAFVDFCGRPQAKVIGRRDEDIFSAAATRIARMNDAKVFESGQPMEFEESLQDTVDSRLYLANKFLLLDDAGKAYALCGIATDITDRKASEQRKLVLERQLLESQKLESLGVLAGGVAHDFNNILTSILGNATLAAMDLSPTDRMAKYLHQIENAAHRAGDLCAQMLAYAGRSSFVTVPVNLSALVHDTAALLEVSVGKRVHLELLTDPAAPAVMGDDTQLRQIVMNLVINAADAMGERTDGHVVVRTFARDLSAEFFEQAVQSPKLPAGRYVGLEVSDNGSGMLPEVITRIFEPFFTTKFSGRGLGLAAVLGITQSHDGALFVESTPGRGTIFRLFLPATLAQPAEPQLATTAATTGFRGTVLVVDDEEPVRSIAEDVLTTLGLSVLKAVNGPAAIDLVRNHPGKIDLVLLDLTMPGLTGDETLRQLRLIRPDLRAVIMSGYSEREIMERCASLGIAGYLPKPFDFATLTEKLRPLLG